MCSRKLSKSESTTLIKLGKALKRLRRSHGLSQEDLAKILGVRRETYGYYERGSRQIGILDIIKIRAVFGKDPLESVSPLKCNAPNDREFEQGDPRKAVTVRRRLPQRMLEFCRNLRSLARRFENEVFSNFGRRWISASSTVYFGMTLAACMRLMVVKLDLHFATPPSSVDWALLFSFGVALCLLPSQITYIVKFVKWRRAHVIERAI